MSKQAFSTKQHVRITDLNYGQHLGMTELHGMVHNARVCFLKSMGLSEMDIGGAGIILIETHSLLKAESFHDDELNFSIEIELLSKTRVKFICTVTSSGDNELVSTIEDTFVCFDYKRKRPVQIPKLFKQQFE